MEDNSVIEIFQKGDFKIEYKNARTTKGTYHYGGIVYYLSKFIKFIPFNDNKELTRKYIINLVNTHEIHSHGISVGTKDNDRIMYHYFDENVVY